MSVVFLGALTGQMAANLGFALGWALLFGIVLMLMLRLLQSAGRNASASRRLPQPVTVPASRTTRRIPTSSGFPAFTPCRAPPTYFRSVRQDGSWDFPRD